MSKDKQVLEQNVLKCNENVHQGTLQFEKNVCRIGKSEKDGGINEDEKNLIDLLFDFFPCMKGHGRFIDKHYADRNSPYYSM